MTRDDELRRTVARPICAGRAATQAAPGDEVERPLTRKQIARLRDLLALVEQSLSGGTAFRWGESERILNTRLLRRAGVELMTKTALTKSGFDLKRGQKPVGTGYYGAPLRVHAGLYLLGIQTRPTPLQNDPPH